jgi:hypothetical protein
MIGMAGRIAHGDHAAERLAEHDRARDLERVAEGAHVVPPLIEVPALRLAAIAAAVAAVVQVDHLRGVGELGEERLEARVVEAGSPVQQQQRRSLAHQGPIGQEPGPLHVEEQPHVVYLHAHPVPL